MVKNAATVIYNFRDAVVEISTMKTTCFGFFIKGHYLICPSSVLYEGVNVLKTVYVQVTNVNNTGKCFSYEAEVVGLDGAGGVAVLKINHEKESNKGNPILKNSHQFLPWGKSRNLSQGDEVLVFCERASILHNRHSSASHRGELLLLSSSGETGQPVVDGDGTVVGMILSEKVALSEFFIRKPVKCLIKKHYGEQDDFVKDSTPPTFRKSCLGIFGVLATQDDLIQTTPREIIGYKVTQTLQPTVVSEGDIVTHINGCPLGNKKGQISPSLVMWRVLPFTQIVLTYKSKSQNFKVVTTEVLTGEFEEDFSSSIILI